MDKDNRRIDVGDPIRHASEIATIVRKRFLGEFHAPCLMPTEIFLLGPEDSSAVAGDMDLIEQYQAVPHDCVDPKCTGGIIRRKLAIFDTILDQLKCNADTLRRLVGKWDVATELVATKSIIDAAERIS
jgi:hypothetical protein